MRTGRLVSLVAIAVCLAGIPASAQGASVCTFESEVEVTPGVTVEPHDGTFRTPTPGTITCTGAIEGTGTITYEGVTGILGETCAFDVHGGGTLAYTIGNDGYTGSFNFSRLAVTGAFSGDTTAGPINGLFQFSPAEGQDCVNTPITNAHVSGQAVIVSY